MPNLTAIYYTAHLEDPRTEEAVRQTHLESLAGIPVISVSQQPLDFGRNICVGDVGVSDMNAFRQYQIGVEAATTKYVCPIEADCVYPPEYFQVTPADDGCFCMIRPMYVLWAMAGKVRRFYPKSTGSENSVVATREYVLDVLGKMLEGCPEWAPGGCEFKHMYHTAQRSVVTIDNPIVTFKTDNNMGRKTPFNSRRPMLELPYWGTVEHMLERYSLLQQRRRRR